MTVDDVTARRFELAVEQAQRSGRPLLDVLDAHGLLVTPARTHETSVRTIELLVRRFEAQDAAKLLHWSTGIGIGTASEMFRAVENWLTVFLIEFSEKRVQP